MNDELLVEINDLRPNPYQERVSEDPEAVKELAENILHNATVEFDGLLQVPTVRAVGSWMELAFGHTRLAAFKYLVEQGHSRYNQMRVVVRELTDLQMFELGVGENMKRRDLNPMEEAHAIHTYMTEFKKDSIEAGAFFNKSPEAIRGAIRLVNLPEKAQVKLRTGEINVTTARALLLVDKLAGAEEVDRVLEEIEEDKDNTPIEIIEDALRDAVGVRGINGRDWRELPVFPVKHVTALTRKDVADILADENHFEDFGRLMDVIVSGMEIAYGEWPYSTEKIERLRVLTQVPACEKCPFHAVLNGDHFCGFNTCADRKDQAWAKHEAESISLAVGIPLYEKSDGAHLDLNVYEAADKKLFKDKHADLRLMPSKNEWNNFEGLNREIKAVVIGETAEKRKKKAEKEKAAQPKSKPQPQTDWELDNRIRNLRYGFEKRFVWEVASPAFTSMLDGITSLPLLEMLVDHRDLPVKAPKAANKSEALKHARRCVAYDLVISRTGHHDTNPVQHWSKECKTIATKLGVKLPKDWDAQVQKSHEEYETARKEIIEKRKAEKK